MRTALPAIFVLLVSTTPVLAEELPPQLPRIQEVTYGGTGCPTGTALAEQGTDGSFRLYMELMRAVVGPGTVGL